MDQQHIHAVTHTLRRLPSRRDVLRGLAGAGLGLNGLWLAGGVAAKKKKRRKKRRAGTVPADTGTVPAAQCLRTCDQRICGSDGCGGSCGSCATDQVCVGGRCESSCPSGQKVCRDACIPNNQCCSNDDCPAASPTCCGGVCVDAQIDERNCGICGRHCTVNEQCVGGECLCGVSSCSTGFSCCTTSKTCTCNPSFPLNLSTCSSVGVAPCPFGTTLCVATTNTCGSGPARVCCPLGSTCTAQGTCRIA